MACDKYVALVYQSKTSFVVVRNVDNNKRNVIEKQRVLSQVEYSPRSKPIGCIVGDVYEDGMDHPSSKSPKGNRFYYLSNY